MSFKILSSSNQPALTSSVWSISEVVKLMSFFEVAEEQLWLQHICLCQYLLRNMNLKGTFTTPAALLLCLNYQADISVHVYFSLLLYYCTHIPKRWAHRADKVSHKGRWRCKGQKWFDCLVNDWQVAWWPRHVDQKSKFAVLYNRGWAAFDI